MTRNATQVDNAGKGKRVFDLADRTKAFALRVVQFAGPVSRNAITLPLISQLVRAGTSVGANYCEADEAVSKRDFRRVIGICKKESRETKYWLEILVKAAPTVVKLARPLWQEAHELHMIFAAIYRRTPTD